MTISGSAAQQMIEGAHWTSIIKEKPMAIFAFDGKGVVETRELPSGDMAVWHPMSSGLRDIVEPICRRRGHWKPSSITGSCFVSSRP